MKLILSVLIGALVVGAMALGYRYGPQTLPDYGFVALFGAVVGLGELVSRYKDEPFKAVWSKPAAFYLAVNGILSIASLGLIHIYNWQIPTPGGPTFTLAQESSAVPAGEQKDATKKDQADAKSKSETNASSGAQKDASPPTTPPVSTAPPSPASVAPAAAGPLATRCTQVLLAGFAAMAFFRSAIFTIRHAGQDLGVGPVVFFQAILSAIDARVDRERGIARIQNVAQTLRGVKFDKAIGSLPAVCLQLLQNPTREDSDRLLQAIAQIQAGTSMDNDAKVLQLGLAIMNVVGEELLAKAVQTLGNSIR